MEFQGVNYKQHGISTGVNKKKSWNFQGFWSVLGIKISEGVTQFCGVSRGEALFCLEFLGVK